MTRISLRGLLTLAAVVVLCLATLKFASTRLLATVSGLAVVASWVCAIVAVVDRGERQAFAIGALIVMVTYGVLVFTAPLSPNADWNSEFSLAGGRFPTTKLLRLMYLGLDSGKWVDSETGKELPNFDPEKQAQRIKVVGGSAVPIDVWREEPPEAEFVRIGHIWWGLLLGFAGGRFGLLVYGRRREEAESRPGGGRELP